MPLRLVPWSNSRRAWQERLSLAAVAAAGVILVVFTDRLAIWLLVPAWAVLLLAAALLFRRDWLKLFGPILWYDLVRTARRTRTYFVRGFYLLTLLAVLGIYYVNEWPYASGGRLLDSQVARFAREFCDTFLVTQFVLMAFLAPAFTAGAVADEKRRKTIQYILATDLRSHEIVLGKLGSRMTHLGLLLLAGLPVLGALEFLGGVDPLLVFVGFAGTAVTMASAAGLGILASVIARPPRTAVLLAYGWVLALAVLFWLGELAPYSLTHFGVCVDTPLRAWLDGALAVFESGNPVAALNDAFTSNPVEQALLRALGAYALFHGILAISSVTAAALLLRRSCLREPAPTRERAAPPRPPVGDRPMMWKEVYTERGSRRRWWGAALLGLLAVGSLGLVLWAWAIECESAQGPVSNDYCWNIYRGYLNDWVRVAGAVGACLTLLGVAMHAAYSIRVEKERETFDTLLTSPVTGEEILSGKWWGAVLSVRGLLLVVFFVWGVGVLGGGLNPLAAPLLALSWFAYAAAMASIGLWFSLVCRSSLRAVLSTLLTVLGLSVGHWLLWLPCACAIRGVGSEWEYIFMAQGGVTPPVVLGVFLPFGYESGTGPPADLQAKFLTFALCGDVAWAFLAWATWQATVRRFQRDGGRVDSGAVRERQPPRRPLS